MMKQIYYGTFLPEERPAYLTKERERWGADAIIRILEIYNHAPCAQMQLDLIASLIAAICLNGQQGDPFEILALINQATKVAIEMIRNAPVAGSA